MSKNLKNIDIFMQRLIAEGCPFCKESPLKIIEQESRAVCLRCRKSYSFDQLMEEMEPTTDPMAGQLKVSEQGVFIGEKRIPCAKVMVMPSTIILEVKVERFFEKETVSQVDEKEEFLVLPTEGDTVYAVEEVFSLGRNEDAGVTLFWASVHEEKEDDAPFTVNRITLRPMDWTLIIDGEGLLLSLQLMRD